MPPALGSQTRYSLYALISAITASSAIVLTEVAMGFYAVSPLLIALYSSVIGGLILMGPIVRRGTGFWRGWPRSDWVRFVAASLAIFVVGMLLVFVAIDQIGASKSAMIGRLESLFVVALAVLILGERWPARRWLATAITLAGTFVVNFDPEALQLTIGFGEWLALTAALVFASGIIIFKPLLDRHDAQLLTGSAMVLGAVVLLPVCIYFDVWSSAAGDGVAQTDGPGQFVLLTLLAMSVLRGLSWSTYSIAMRHIGASRCSILFLTSVFLIVAIQVGLDAIAPGLGLRVPANLTTAVAGGSLIVLGIVLLQRS